MATTLNQELWTADFAAKLFPSNEFYSNAKNDSRYVNFNTVNIPVYSGVPTISALTTGTSVPVSASRIADTIQTYSMATYISAPEYIHNIDATEFAYDLRMEHLDSHINHMNDYIGKIISTSWASPITATGSIVDTTGATRVNRFGNTAIKSLTFADLRSASLKLDLQNVPSTGRKLLVDPYMWSDLQLQAQTLGSDLIIERAVAENSVGRVMGFDVYMRSWTPSYTAAKAALKTVATADGATDLSAAIAYHPDLVRFAAGNKDNAGVKVFLQNDSPEYYGDVFSTLTRVGASTTYKEVSNAIIGVVTIIESK